MDEGTAGKEQDSISSSGPSYARNPDNRTRCAYCYVQRGKQPERKFFKFPKDPEQCKLWVKACNLPYLMKKSPLQLHASYKLCNLHFRKEDFASKKGHRLKLNACPDFSSDEASADDTDAEGFFGNTKTATSYVPVLNISPDAHQYDMNHRHRGRCVIFNNKEFDAQLNLESREGTEKDATNLEERFSDLGFNVVIHPDLEHRRIIQVMQEEAKLDHSDSDCFVCCILTHGKLGILFGKDGKFLPNWLFEPFYGNACPTLAGKPKIFFIQACQGDNLDSGVLVFHRQGTDSAISYKIPTHADFFIAYSTVPGYFSWRNESSGSWFIQALCTVLKKHGHTMDLQEMMTIATRMVAYEFESRSTDRKMCMKKEVPFVTSTLTRKIYFPPKLENEKQ